MTFVTARNGLRTKTAEYIAQLAGGEFFRFHDMKSLKAEDGSPRQCMAGAVAATRFAAR